MVVALFSMVLAHEKRIEDIQEDLVAVLDETRSPEAVCDRLQRALSQLRSRKIDPAELVIEQRTSKTGDKYAHTTRTVAALKRAADDGRRIQPGQGVSYVVVDDSKPSCERVQLAFEADEYEIRYIRDDLRTRRLKSEVDKMIDRLRGESRSGERRSFPFGEVNGIVRSFEEAMVMHFPSTQGRGTVVTLDPEAARQLNTFIGSCLERTDN